MSALINFSASVRPRVRCFSRLSISLFNKISALFAARIPANAMRAFSNSWLLALRPSFILLTASSPATNLTTNSPAALRTAPTDEKITLIPRIKVFTAFISVPSAAANGAPTIPRRVDTAAVKSAQAALSTFTASAMPSIVPGIAPVVRKMSCSIAICAARSSPICLSISTCKASAAFTR